MSMEAEDELLAHLVEQYHLRQASGGRPRAEEFEAEAGEGYGKFLEILEQERLIDAAIEENTGERFPRTFGEYTLIGPLGRGGVGVVYRAVQRALARTVALKVLQGGWADDKELLERFKRGARAAAQVEHDHVVHIYDFGVFEGRPFIAMSYLSGHGLNKVLAAVRAAGPLPFRSAHHAALDGCGVPGAGFDTLGYVRRIAALFAGPADALHQYHERGIIHRDVKPGNLLLDGEERLVLTDFDLAKTTDTSFKTMAGSTLGTPAYMSPEQWDPMIPDVDRRADVYALGAALYEALTLRPPFVENEDASRLMRRVLQEKPADPRVFVPDLPLEARRVVLKALEKRRDDRYQTAADFAADLRALAGGQAVQARPVPLSTRAARFVWDRRGRIAAALFLATAALVFYARRPATLHILPVPHADVYLDGERLGRSPIREHRLASGSHELRARRKGFAEDTRRIEVEAGGSIVYDPALRALDENDPEVWVALAEITGIRITPPSFSTSRGGEEPPPTAVALTPRGTARLGDLERVRFELNAPVRGALVFETADGKTIHTEPLEAGAGAVERPMPEAVRRAAGVGLAVRWGVVLATGEKFLAPVQVAPDLAPERAAALRAAAQAGSPYVAKLMEIALLQQEGLFGAALDLALDLEREWPTKQVLGMALESIDALSLQDSALAHRLATAHARAPR